MAATSIEPGQSVRWRSRRWRVLGQEEGGFLRLVGTESVNRDHEALALLDLERDRIEPDELPLPKLDVERSDRARWRALHEAYRITMAGGREQLVGLDWGAVAVEPYQLVPLLRVARSLRSRLLIADDTGLGKTAEAGILLRWLAQRHQANRVLILTRAAPEPQRWKEEMWTKFGFRFDILNSGADFAERRREVPNVNVFAQENRLIVSMTLAARQAFLDELRQCPAPFDVVIVDEAHHLAERGKRTKRLAVLGRALGQASKNGALLLLTATPHDGKTASFVSLLRLLDPFVEIEEETVSVDVASRLMVRRLKPEVTLAGDRRFIEPEIHVLSTIREASPQERAIEPILGEYKTWLDSERQRFERENARQKATGCEFLAGTLLKRYGSSVAALRATLRRRLGLPPADEDTDISVPFVETDSSDPEDDVLDPGAEAETPPPPLSPGEHEIAKRLLDAAAEVPRGRDAKLQALVKLLGGRLEGQKAVVFTEYRDTLRAAARRLDAEGIAYTLFHGGTPDHERNAAIHEFLTDPSIRVFLATDAASEGKNLQHGVHHLIHLDVPWNPNRYLQRNGRIDRYGQRETPHIWALVAADRKGNEGRPEYRALEIVIEKLRKIQQETGSVGRVLPNFTSGRVREVLTGAVADAENQLDRLIEDDETERANEELTRLMVHNREELRSAHDYVEALGTIDDFRERLEPLLRTTFHGWGDGGVIADTGDNTVRVTVPRRLRDQLGAEVPRATFNRRIAVASQEANDEEPIEFLTPAHPLVVATLRAIRDDARDPGFAHRFDVEIDSSEGLVISFITRYIDGESRTVDERLEPVEVSLDGTASRDGRRDLGRLGITKASAAGHPDVGRIDHWKSRFTELAAVARREAERRVGEHLRELDRIAGELAGEEREALGRWKSDEKDRIERISFGTGGTMTFDELEAYEERVRRLETEYERRLNTLRDRAEIRLASLELLGGRLLVRSAG
jgi:superfamily II DNA or RNA helicase